MATYYFRNTGDTNWGTASNWSLTDGGGATGAVPTAADDAYFTSNSGNCTVNGANRACLNLIFSGVGAGNYAGTITMTFSITPSGNVTLSATMTIAGTGGLILGASTFTSNGKTWPNALTFSGTITVTLADNLSVTGLLTLGAITFNGIVNINASGGISPAGLIQQGTGTTTLNLLGGTWSGAGTIRLNTVINGNITISGNVYYNTGTLTYTSGTVTVTGSTLNIGASTTLNTSGMSWNNVTFSATNTTTLSSNLNINGLLTISGATTVNGSYNINCNGGLSALNTLAQGTGLTSLNLLGGTWSGNQAVSINTNINGNIILSGTLNYQTRILTYISGTITTSGSTINITSATLDTSGMTWNNVNFANNTLISDLNVGGLFAIGANPRNVNGNFNINCYGGISMGDQFTQGTGTTTLNLLGGTWTAVSTASFIGLNTTINGNITISGTVAYRTGTLTYTSGTVTVTGSTLNIGASTTLNTSGMSWNNVSISGAGLTITNNSAININGTFRCGVCILNGSDFNVFGNFEHIASQLATKGTAVIYLKGNLTWSNLNNPPYRFNNDVVIDSGANTVTLIGRIGLDGSTITYTSGTVVTTGSTIWINYYSNVGVTLNTAGITWDNVIIYGFVTTLTSDLNINGLLTISSSTVTVNGGFDINANGGISLSAAISQGTGITTVNLLGGTWSTTSVNGILRLNTFINGNITISGTVYYNTGTLTYTSGTVSHINNSILSVGLVGGTSSTTLNLGGIILEGFNTRGTSTTITLLSDISINGYYSQQGVVTFNGTFTINSAGGIGVTNNISQGAGVTTLNLTGGIWTGSGSIRINTNINGNITISGNVYYNTGTLTYTSGTVTSTGSTINISAATTITVNNSGLTLENITATANVTFSGTNGCTINGTYSCSTAGTTHIFVSTLTYIINALSIAGTNASRNTLRSSTPGSKAILNFTNISVNYRTNVTDINSSGGAAGWTFGGTLSNTDNWNVSTTLYYVGTANFSATGSWSPYSGGIGIVSMSAPAAGEAIAFDANSVNDCNVNVASTCGSINFTGYSGTLSFSNLLRASTATIILSPTMNIVAPQVDIRVLGLAALVNGLVLNGSCTFTSNGKVWSGNITNETAGATLTLTDPLTVTGLFSTINTPMNLAAGQPLNLYGGLSNQGQIIGGTINIYGGLSRLSLQSVTANFYGDVKVITYFTFIGGTFTIVSGSIDARNITASINTNNCTFINFDKAIFRGVTIIGGNPVLTFNKFFSGTASLPMRIQTSVGSNYTVAFTDNFEKITKFTKISNCTLSRPGQLLCLTPNSNKGRNVGIRYYNQSPNSIPKGSPSVTDPMVYGLTPGIADPLFVTS